MQKPSSTTPTFFADPAPALELTPGDQAPALGKKSPATPLSVSELTARIKNQLEMNYPSVSVQGELSNFKRQSSGHLYFSLKDEGAQIQVALFAGSASKLTFEPRDGDQVVVRGSISVYSQRGQYQILAKSLEKVGLGEILLKLEALKNELKNLGWLDPSKKRALPKMPACIGVVTSPTGAVIRDILHVLNKRHSGFHLILYPARVQGAGAAQEIAEGVRTLNRSKLCEVIIVARGGGSFEDLMPFNEKELLQAIHESELPIISAVGHETDFTLCDFVADFRAPTPSAAAERVLPAKNQLQEQLNHLEMNARRQFFHRLEQAQSRLEAFKKSRFLVEPLSLIQPIAQRLDESSARLQTTLGYLVERQRSKLDKLTEQSSPRALISLLQRSKLQLEGRWARIKNELDQIFLRHTRLLEFNRQELIQKLQRLHHRVAVRFAHVRSSLPTSLLFKHLERCRLQLKGQKETLEALSPESAVRRGYAILRNEKHQPIQRIEQLACGDLLEIQLQDGKVWSLVQRLQPKISKPSYPQKNHD